ncbi:hypothetical protein C8R43DRAFT_941381 [Mycena crocata]|nr:hypothetical protein C8R43DRAFT_941381 [Mycena crocata]
MNARGVGLWRAPVEGVAREVIPLDAMYFSQEAANVLDLHVKECGCQTSGVGCMICGNPLGALSTSYTLSSPPPSRRRSLASIANRLRRWIHDECLRRRRSGRSSPFALWLQRPRVPRILRSQRPLRTPQARTWRPTRHGCLTLRMSTAGRPRRGSRGNPPTVSSTAPPGVASPETPTDAPAADAPRIGRRVRLGAFGFGLGEWDVFNNSDRGSSRVTASPNSGSTDADAGRSLASAMDGFSRRG